MKISPPNLPSCSCCSPPNWVINCHYLARNCLIIVNRSSSMSSFFLAGHVIIAQLSSAPYTSLAVNHHVVVPHLHCCTITILPSSFHHSNARFVLSVTGHAFPFFQLHTSYFPLLHCCALDFTFVCVFFFWQK